MANITLFYALIYSILFISSLGRKPAGHRLLSGMIAGICNKTVDLNGSGDFKTIQSAVDSVPEFNTLRFVICIKAGIYTEKVTVPPEKPYITFQGEGLHVTKITWHDKSSDKGSNGVPIRTYNTSSVAVLAGNFVARNISFMNTAALQPLAGQDGWQAVALRISGDRAYFTGCGFYGAQDTLLDDSGRHYFKECYIEGSIDFVFGNGRSLYKDCELHSIATDFGAIAAHGRVLPADNSGFAFVRCKVTGNGRVYVGRAMGQYARIVYAYTVFDLEVRPDSWDPWTPNSGRENTAYFGYYKCSGEGADNVAKVTWAHSLAYEDAHPFLSPNFVNAKRWITPADF